MAFYSNLNLCLSKKCKHELLAPEQDEAIIIAIRIMC